MPFIETLDEAKSKLRLNDVRVPVLIGIVALVLAMLVVLGVNACAALTGDGFVVSKDEGFASSPNEGLEANASSSAQESSDSSSGSKPGAPAGTSTGEDVTVYVCGEVEQPGVYSFAQGDRLQDAVNAAGGFTANASQDALNLARVLQDGEQVKVPSVEELANEPFPQASSSETGGVADQSQGGGLVSINTASAAELESLPGIGQATAAKIIASREAEGPFQSVEDLMRVSGIGQKKFEALRDLVCL